MVRFRAVALALCALIALGSGCDQKPQSTAVRPAPLVSTMVVQARDVPVTGYFVGQTEGSRSVELRAQVSGILVSRNYEEGSYVQKGTLMFEIEPDTYKAALAQAEGALAQVRARYTQAQQDLNRMRPLYAQNAVSRRDLDGAQAAFDAAKADLVSAQAAVDEANIKLSYAYVIAPIDGYAGQEQRSVGNLINAASPSESLLTVVNQVDPIYANFSIPSPKLMRMRTLLAQKRLSTDNVYAKITLADGSEYPREGRVTFIDKAVSPDTSVVAARAEFPNPKLFVLPGQFVRISIYGPKLLNVILVPQKAVIQTQKGSMVVVVGKDNIAEMRPVVLSDMLGDVFLLEEGLTSGERIVIEGANKAIPGQPVRIDEASSNPELSHEADLLSSAGGRAGA